MSGIGSGRHWYWAAKDTTDEYQPIDMRRWKRDGLLDPYQSFYWQWSHHGDVVAGINARTKPYWVLLSYRLRRGTEDWKEENYPVYLDWTAWHR